MTYYVVKIAVTTALVVLVSEVAKRSSLIGAIIASVPLVSVMAIIWLYAETGDVSRITALAKSIVWLVLPSLALFIVLPVLLERGTNFYASLSVSILATVACYFAAILIARRLGFDV